MFKRVGRFKVCNYPKKLKTTVNNSFSKKRLDEGTGYEDYISFNRMCNGYSKYDISAEIEANQIAAEILMREETVKDLMGQNLTPEEMAQKFNVSPSAMVVRLQKIYPDIEIM